MFYHRLMFLAFSLYDYDYVGVCKGDGYWRYHIISTNEYPTIGNLLDV